MGKVVSAVANFATKVVTAVAKVLGPVGTVIVGAIVLGPIGLLGALVGANVATSITITDIKKRIEDLIKENQTKVDEAEALKSILQKCFFDDQTFEYLLKLGSQLRSNLQIVLQDQKEKINNLKNITLMHGLKADDYKTSGDGMNTLLAGLGDIARLAMDGVAIASGNPMGIVMAAIDIGMMTFMNVKNLFNNIEQIEKLENTEKELKEYLKPGGQFEKQMDEIVTYALDIVRNLCTVCYFWNSLVNELSAWINIFQVLQPTARMIRFDVLLQKLTMSPVTPEFVEKVSNLQQKINNISSSKSQSHDKLHQVYELMINFEKQNPVQQVFAKVKTILMDFTEESIVYTELKNYIKEFSDVNFLIEANKHLFLPNSILDSNSTLKERDQQILEELRERVTIKDKELPPERQKIIIEGKLLLIIGANTEKFYADDETGQTIFGISIASIREKGNYIKFLNSAGGDFKKSIIQEPEPLPELERAVIRHKNIKTEMLKRWNRPNSEEQLKRYKLYLKIEAIPFKVGEVSSNRLKLIRVIEAQSKQTFSCSNEEIMRAIYSLEQQSGKPPIVFSMNDQKMYFFAKQEHETETDDEVGSYLTTKLKPDTYNEVVRDHCLDSILQKGEDFVKAYSCPNTLQDIKIEYNSAKQYYQLYVKTGAKREKMRYIYRSDLLDCNQKIATSTCHLIETTIKMEKETKKVAWILAE